MLKWIIIIALVVLGAGYATGYITNQDLSNAASNVVLIKGSAQYCQQYPEDVATCGEKQVSTVEIITPEPTPTPKPTVTVQALKPGEYVDPFAPGQRWERQWFRWTALNVSGLQKIDRGIVIYNHQYLNSFTVWDYTWGNYYQINPDPGMRFLAVFVHQEEFSPDNSGWYGYQNESFRIQYNGDVHNTYSKYDYRYPIRELETVHGDYYGIDFAKPYGMQRVYIGRGYASTGGYRNEYLYSLWYGKGNAWDGYLLYQVPVSITDNDFFIVGNFGGKGVYWRFDNENALVVYPSDPTTRGKPAYLRDTDNTEPLRERVNV